MTAVHSSRLVARVLVEQEPPALQATQLIGRLMHVAVPPVQASRLVLRVFGTDSVHSAPVIGGQMYPRGGTRADVTAPGGSAPVDAALIRGVVVSENAPSDGDALIYDADLGMWVPGPIAGGSGAGYNFDAPEASPSALDDDFDGPTLDAKWTQVNIAGLAAWDVGVTFPGGLWMQKSTLTTISAVVQPLPSGDFTIQTALEMATLHANFQYAGIIFSDTNNGTSGTQVIAALVSNNNSYASHVQKYTSWASFAGALGTGLDGRIWQDKALVVRLRRSGAAYTVGWSPNGRVWMGGAIAPGFTPTFAGVFTLRTAGAFEAGFQHFRYSSDPTKLFGA